MPDGESLAASSARNGGSAGGPPPAPPAAPWRPSANPWLIGVVVALGAFMEVLDTSIANVALPYIAGSLGATNDQSTWVLTSYLVSNAIVLPISGWIAGRVGRKRFFMICLMIFTVSSVLCGFAPSLPALLFFRVLQGAGGGGLQPMAQAILADTFPPEKRGVAFALYGITAIIAPTIGPTLGGWITDNYSWRWIFLINLPIGAATMLLVYRLVEDPPWIRRAATAGVKLDYVGIGFLTVGIGSLQVMLDKGQEDDWFASRFILTLAILAAVGLVSLVIWEWRQRNPIVDVHLFRNLNFLGANFMMFVVGIILFSSLVLMPQFLQTLLGYTAQKAGLVLSGGGLLLLFEMPIVGTLADRVQARRLISFGWLTLCLGMFYSTQRLSLQISFEAASILRLVQVFGLGFLFVPINISSYVGIPPEKNNAVAGIINFTRNIGSSVGTSLVTTLVARRAQVHQTYLVAHTTAGHPAFLAAHNALATRLAIAGLDASVAGRQALARLYREVILQATTLAYIDVFWILATGAAIMFLLSFGLRPNQPGAGGAAAVG